MCVRKELEDFILQPIATHGSLKSQKLYADLDRKTRASTRLKKYIVPHSLRFKFEIARDH